MTGQIVRNIGRYQIEREIGRGGMAIVYRAFDPELDRIVAIKLIRRGAFPPEQFEPMLARFRREAKALAKLDHPNIVKVLDFGEFEGAPFLVMEYLEGATLKEVRKPLKVETAVRIIRPIAEALDYVHGQGILHRDVKPSNIMITKAEKVILTDFGIAKWMEDDPDHHTLTATGVGIGTPEYMAPEQGRGQGIDGRTDAYSLSVVFYELITGQKPYQGDTPLDVLMKQAGDPIPDPREIVPGLNESVKRFLDRAMAKKPEDRYPTMNDYLRDLDGLRLQSIAMAAAGTSGIQFRDKDSTKTGSSVRFREQDFQKVREVQPTPVSSGKRFVFAKKRIIGFVSAAVLIAFGWVLTQSMIQRTEERKALTEAAVLIATNQAQEATLAALSLALTATGKANIDATATEGAILAQANADATATEGAILAQANAEASATANSMATETVRHEMRLTAHAQGNATSTAAASAKITATAEAMGLDPFRDVKVGGTVFFGRYEQDNNLSNGAEPIEWRVLDVFDDGRSAVLISRFGLEEIQYHSRNNEPTDWEDSTVRRWLNNEFYQTAFTGTERARIYNVVLESRFNGKHEVFINDHVFILNFQEAEIYFADDDDQKAKPTNYAMMNGATVSPTTGASGWWLRSSDYSEMTDEILPEGKMLGITAVSRNGVTVRPVIKVSTLSEGTAIPEVLEAEIAPIAEQVKNAKVGETITFGRYEQDDNRIRGKEAIEWIVLEKKGNEALLISKYGLDSQPYHSDLPDSLTIDWETCSLREWLNLDFYQVAFNEDERSMIKTSRVVIEDQEENPILVTMDKVFVLSSGEVYELMPEKEQRAARTTTFADYRGAWTNRQSNLEYGYGWWWLRYSDGAVNSDFSSAVVDFDGWVNDGGVVAISSYGSVRPVIRITF